MVNNMQGRYAMEKYNCEETKEIVRNDDSSKRSDIYQLNESVEKAPKGSGHTYVKGSAFVKPSRSRNDGNFKRSDICQLSESVASIPIEWYDNEYFSNDPRRKSKQLVEGVDTFIGSLKKSKPQKSTKSKASHQGSSDDSSADVTLIPSTDYNDIHKNVNKHESVNDAEESLKGWQVIIYSCERKVSRSPQSGVLCQISKKSTFNNSTGDDFRCRSIDFGHSSTNLSLFSGLPSRKDNNTLACCNTRRTSNERVYPSSKGTSKWQKFIKEQDEKGIRSLIARGILPNTDDLDLACYKFGRRSQTFSNILTFTCEHIKSQSSDISNVWASYDTNEYEKSGKIHIVFVVITECAAPILGEISRAYSVCKRQKQEINMESKVILESRLSDVTQGKNGDITESTLDELSSCVAKNANYLMEKHININAIYPNTKKSTGFGTPNHKIIDIPCITIYVHVKGLTPIKEDPFPKQICGFQTDVTEEKLSLFHGGPLDYHNNLKMGTAIHANIKTPTGDVLGGTLGCFLDHKYFGLCCLTSLHTVLNAAEIRQIQNKAGSFDMRSLKRRVYQPCGMIDEKSSFGQLISAVCREGDDATPGVEAALIQIFQRPPLKGDFPDADNYADAGFDEVHPLLFNSGNVCDVCHIHKHMNVYKFGISTGCTRGCLGLRGGSIRKTEVGEDTCMYKLRNQLEILPVGRTPFATEGDSGALVMIQDNANDSTAIGIVTGGFSNGTVFATPICAILDAFGCPRALKSFTDKADRLDDSGVSSMPEEMEYILNTLV